MACAVKIGRMWHIQWADRGRTRRITTKVYHDGKARPPRQVEDLITHYRNLESDLYHGLERPGAPVRVDDAVRAYLADNTKARLLSPDGRYTLAARPEGTPRHRVQEEFLRHYTATPLEMPRSSPATAAHPGATGTTGS